MSAFSQRRQVITCGLVISAIILSAPAQVFAKTPTPLAAKTATESSAGPLATELSPADVALGPRGEFVGRVVNLRGEPWTGVKVRLMQDQKLIATPITDDRGEFRIRHLRGGTYQVQTEDSFISIRTWAPGTAPPSAAAFATVAPNIQRGQSCTTPGCRIPGCAGRCGQGNALGVLLHPAVIATAIGAAIAIPLALDDDDDDAS